MEKPTKRKYIVFNIGRYCSVVKFSNAYNRNYFKLGYLYNILSIQIIN